MKQIDKFVIADRLEQAKRQAQPYDLPEFHDPKMTSAIILMLIDHINEQSIEINYQRNRRVQLEEAMQNYGIELPPPPLLENIAHELGTPNSTRADTTNAESAKHRSSAH